MKPFQKKYSALINEHIYLLKKMNACMRKKNIQPDIKKVHCKSNREKIAGFFSAENEKQ